MDAMVSVVTIVSMVTIIAMGVGESVELLIR
jgi:hypothetical protein